MSIYGISRLLASRELGPAQIVPTLEAFASEAGERCGRLDDVLDALAAELRPHTDLVEALDVLVPVARRVRDDVVETFIQGWKLGARERLELEVRAPSVGGELQAVRELIEVLRAAADPQTTPLRMHDFLSGSWRPRPTFVARRLEVMVGCGGPGLRAEPRILRAMLQAALRDIDIAQPFLWTDGAEILIDSGEASAAQTIERAVVLLGPGIEGEQVVLDAIGRHVRTMLTIDAHAARIQLVA